MLKCVYTGLDLTAKSTLLPHTQPPVLRLPTLNLKFLLPVPFIPTSHFGPFPTHHSSIINPSHAPHKPAILPGPSLFPILQLSWSPLQTAFSTTPSRTQSPQMTASGSSGDGARRGADALGAVHLCTLGAWTVQEAQYTMRSKVTLKA